MLLQKYLCSRQLLGTDFATVERIYLKRVAVSCISDLTLHSVPQPSIASLHALYLDSLPSLLTPEDDHVLLSIRTYTKTSLTSLAATPTPVLAQSPSASSLVHALHVSSSGNTFAAEETSFTPSSVSVNASDGELRHIHFRVLPQSLEQGILC
jgi:hypothetical protein